jgi:hypothetical protein
MSTVFEYLKQTLEFAFLVVIITVSLYTMTTLIFHHKYFFLAVWISEPND